MIFLQKFNISKDVFRQFPLVLVFGILSALLSLYLNHFDRFLQTELLFKIFYFFVNSMVFSASLSLFFEKQNFSVLKKSVIYLVTFGLIGIVFLYGDTYSYVFMGFCSFLTLIFAKFLFKSSLNESFLFFTNNLLKILFYTFVLIPIVLLGGVVLIVASIEYLFGINLVWVIADISSVLFFIILPIYFISSVYKMNDFKPKMFDFGKFSSVFIQYVLVGLLSVYLVVLYVYFAKITIFFELPKGGLSWMILIFSSFVILVKIFLLGVQNKHKLALFFDKYAFAFLLVPIVFLDIAIFRRIYDYGLTEFRIILALIDIWLTLIVAFYFMRKNLHFKYIFMSLCISFFVFSMPFINLEKIAANSQIERFKKILIKNKILQNGEIVYQKNIPSEIRTQIDDLSKYLADNAYAVAKLKKLIGNDIDSSKDLMTAINVQSLKKEQDFKIFSSFDYTIADNVKDYDYFYKHANTRHYEDLSIHYANNKEVKFGAKGMNAFLHFENTQTMSYDIALVIENLKEHNMTKIDKDTIKYTTITKENENIRVKLQILSIVTKKVDNNSSIDDIEANIFIKELK